MAGLQGGGVVVRQARLHRHQRLGNVVLDGAPDAVEGKAMAPHPMPVRQSAGAVKCVFPLASHAAQALVCVVSLGWPASKRHGAHLRACSDHLFDSLPPVPDAEGKLPLMFCLLTAWLVRCMQSS